MEASCTWQDNDQEEERREGGGVNVLSKLLAESLFWEQALLNA